MNNLKTLYDNLISQGTLRSEAVKKALFANDRADFVPGKLKEYAYEDSPLPIGEGQTISQPTTVVFMLELLQAMPGNTVLEIGAGSGWVTALLASMVGKTGKIHSFEIKKEIANFGKKNLAKYSYQNIEYYSKDYIELLDKLPRPDRILGGAAFKPDYRDLVDVLAENGRMVVPTAEQDIRLIRKNDRGQADEESFPGFIFVPIVH